MKRNSTNKAKLINSKRTTTTWFTVWTTRPTKNGYSPDIVRYEPKDLNENFSSFSPRSGRKLTSVSVPGPSYLKEASGQYFDRESLREHAGLRLIKQTELTLVVATVRNVHSLKLKLISLPSRINKMIK